MSNWYEKGLCFSVILVLLGMLAFTIAGCIQAMDRITPIVIEPSNETSPDNTIIINLPSSEKLQTINWERTSNNRRLWILTRPMHSGETPEVYKYSCVDSDQCYEICETQK